ncbi:putative transcription factor C2H2 family [Dioscorea sansibarensis]
MAVRIPSRRMIRSCSFDLEDKQLKIDWDDVICPICLDFPHNSVLLQCSSYAKGCRPFMCNTDVTHSNCLDRFKNAYGMSNVAKCSLATNEVSEQSNQSIPPGSEDRPTCPLCRGDVTGWVVVEEARAQLNLKKRCCEEKQCSYVGNYVELQKHIKLKHPYSRPSEVDPAHRLDWENFQQSSEIVDVLSVIHSEVPHGVVLGDYVIEYGNVETGDEYEDFPRSKGSWWTSCIMCQVFDKRASRNRRRSRTSEERRSSHRSSSTSSSLDDVYRTSIDIADYQYNGMDDEFVGRVSSTASRGSEIHRRHRRHRSHVYR